ncbi:MAG: zinc-ribbon domain-containing protein [Candidatus Micrarchaeota archaeon]
MAYCSNCSAKVSASNQFCPGCGAKLIVKTGRDISVREPLRMESGKPGLLKAGGIGFLMLFITAVFGLLMWILGMAGIGFGIGWTGFIILTIIPSILNFITFLLIGLGGFGIRKAYDTVLGLIVGIMGIIAAILTILAVALVFVNGFATFIVGMIAVVMISVTFIMFGIALLVKRDALQNKTWGLIGAICSLVLGGTIYLNFVFAIAFTFIALPCALLAAIAVFKM